MTDARKILVTSALPYANGSLHLGNMVEHIQTDIWSRFMRCRGHHCITICGDDAHGTPIMVKAQQQGIDAEKFVMAFKAEHENDLRDFGIHYDNYYTTHSPENRELSAQVYLKLKARGDIATRTISQSFDPVKNMFLPDRFVKGECPRCKAADQYGDNCESCGATYSPTELKNPVSVLSGATPIQKETEHYFFKLPHYEELLSRWTRSGHLQEQVANKMDEWFKAGLQEWDISRDAPYFGFEIPGAPGKYFYVWLDAPIGYMASFKNYCDRVGLNFDEYWAEGSTTELYHFVGKDIIYFHALFWPAMLAGAGYRLPTAINTHGFLTVDGLKMSKSRGTFIKARTYLNHLNPEYLRYYFAAKLTSRVDDLDLNFDDFINRVNADLVGKVVNIASRNAGFINKHFDNRLSAQVGATDLLQQITSAQDAIATAFESREYASAVRIIMELADRINQYIDEKKPWQMIKVDVASVQQVCSDCLNAFRVLMIYLKPITPKMAQAVETFLRCEPLSWNDINKPLLDHTIDAFTPLMTRVDKNAVDAMKTETKDDLLPSGA